MAQNCPAGARKNKKKLATSHAVHPFLVFVQHKHLGKGEWIWQAKILTSIYCQSLWEFEAAPANYYVNCED